MNGENSMVVGATEAYEATLLDDDEIEFNESDDDYLIDQEDY